MIMALYGHPESGGGGEQFAEKTVLTAGFLAIAEWRSVFIHPKLQLILTIYVDDFLLAGPKQNLAIGWKAIQAAGVELDHTYSYGEVLRLQLTVQNWNSRGGS